MSVLYWIYMVLGALIVLQLVYPFLTVLAAQLFGKEALPKEPKAPEKQYDYGCIITAYKNAEIARPLIESLLRQPYPNLHVYLVADECPPFEPDAAHPQLTVLQPDPPLRLKAKSIIHAMETYVRPHDYTVIFDADNLAHPKFLQVVNQYANAGHRCIQGQRAAKNLDNQYAAADSLGEIYKNYIERYVPYLLGGSSVISGSGMATETNLYWEYLRSPEIEQGKHLWKKMLQEDKILQNFLLRRDSRIVYAQDAICYDEKTTSAAGVETQRSRWLFSYFQNVPNALGILRRGLFGLSLQQLYFGFVTIAMPMFMQIGVAAILFLLGLLIAPSMSAAIAVASVIFVLNILWILKLDKAPKSVWDALYSAPGFVFRQIKGLLRMGDPNKNFGHTVHTRKVTIDELLNQNDEHGKN
jgi:cellulose synthase/poly-beta-1,6-N-acetylglucosamine synthase-like glycosyltransferase